MLSILPFSLTYNSCSLLSSLFAEEAILIAILGTPNYNLINKKPAAERFFPSIPGDTQLALKASVDALIVRLATDHPSTVVDEASTSTSPAAMGRDYGVSFDKNYKVLAKKYDVVPENQLKEKIQWVSHSSSPTGVIGTWSTDEQKKGLTGDFFG